MDPDVRITDRLPTLKVRRRELGDAELRDNGGNLWNRGAQRCERDRVFSRFAALNPSDALVAMRCRQVVFVRGQSVAMLRMIVIRVNVRMQQRPRARGRHQRRNEEERQDAPHNEESMGQPAGGQNVARPREAMAASMSC